MAQRAYSAAQPTNATRNDNNTNTNILQHSLASMAIDESVSANGAGNNTGAPSSSSAALVASPTNNNTSPAGANSKKKAISYAAERVIGNGSFGVVYQATVIDTGQTVAIKKVLQDRRFKNRELEIMSQLNHPNIIGLRHCFYSKGERSEEVYLNLVMEYIPETIHRTLRNHTKANKLVPLIYTKIYMFQITRALAHIHSLGICHRDIKPQNLLLNPKTHQVKLCDFGSAKPLIRGENNVSYICSRYYRAPELVLEATQYTCAIDLWSLGCVLVELLQGAPLFPGESGVGQLIEIIRVLGSPTRDELFAMNPNHSSFTFPQIKAQPWSKIIRSTKVPQSAIDLASQWLRYRPTERLAPFDALLHPFFDELRMNNLRMPNGREMPRLFDWTDNDLQLMRQRGEGFYEKITPAWAMLPQHAFMISRSTQQHDAASLQPNAMADDTSQLLSNDTSANTILNQMNSNNNNNMSTTEQASALNSGLRMSNDSMDDGNDGR